jgi:hypothetical protein
MFFTVSLSHFVTGNVKSNNADARLSMLAPAVGAAVLGSKLCHRDAVRSWIAAQRTNYHPANNSGSQRRRMVPRNTVLPLPLQ